MDIGSLWTLQIMMFLLVAAGAFMKKQGVLGPESRGVITDLVIDFILPCNIINSFRAKFDISIFKGFAIILFISAGVQLISYIISRTIYNSKEESIKKVLQYCTIVSNSGFLGLPIIEGVYGAQGVMYASIFLIPMRIMMWTAGIACFTESPEIKAVIKKLLLHPCIVALYIGLPMLIFQEPLGSLYQSVIHNSIPPVSIVVRMLVTALDNMLRSAGGCTTTLTMILIGTMLAELKTKDFLNFDALYISFIRMGVLPFLVFMICRIFRIDGLLTGVCVLLTGMPAGSTSAILAAKYGCDYQFATKCVVVSTLLSMLTIPLWCMII